MAKHIGIVACSGPGAALCFETLCTEAPARMGGRYAHPEVSMHNAGFGLYMDHIERDDWPAVGELMLDSAAKLAAIGARFLICPDNTIHQSLPLIADRSPLPWLHIADAVAAEAARIGATRIGVLGTRWLMQSDVYPPRLAAAGMAAVVPGPVDRETINSIIFEELVYGRVTEHGRAVLSRIIESLRRDERCDGVVLGCTELPLAVTHGVSSLPTLDSTRLLARAAIAHSLDADPRSA